MLGAGRWERHEPVPIAILYAARVVTVLMIVGGLRLVVWRPWNSRTLRRCADGLNARTAVGGLVDVLQLAAILVDLRQLSSDAFAISTAVSVTGALVGGLAFVATPR